MNLKKGIFVLSALLLMSASTVSAFAYYGNQDVRGDAVCTDEQRMDRVRLNQSTNEFAQERIEERKQLADGTCDGSMPQLQVRSNKRLNKNISD